MKIYTVLSSLELIKPETWNRISLQGADSNVQDCTPEWIAKLIKAHFDKVIASNKEYNPLLLIHYGSQLYEGCTVASWHTSHTPVLINNKECGKIREDYLNCNQPLGEITFKVNEIKKFLIYD